MGEIGRENGAKLASKLNKLKILCLISAKAQNYYFPIDFEGFLKFKGSFSRGKIDLGGSWRPLGGLLGASWRLLEASWKASWALLEASWRPLGGLMGRLEPS